MRPQNQHARERLNTELRRHAPTSAIILADRLDVSVPTIHRMLRERNEQIVRQGTTKNARYALRRPLRGKIHPIPVYGIDANGHGHAIGNLDLIAPEGALLDLLIMGWPSSTNHQRWWGGLPYPLYDMRPQGFIGRNFARQITKDFAVSDNPNDWLDDDIAHVLSLKGADCPGNLIIGDVAYEQWLKSLTTPSNKLTDKELPDHYAELANIATSHGIAGSSAGGEFPKFITQRQLAHTQTPHVIVKFSGADHSTAVRRWADLLACEHLALAVLDKSTHINAASSRIIHSHGRTFLEVERFDRFGDFGRKPVVSLSSLDGAFVGVGSGAWTDVAKKLVDLSILEQDLLDDILVLWWYGKLIGNTDMHFGNLSFLFDANPHQKPSLKLSPVYDMLPMLYAPLSGGEVPSRIYEPLLPLPREQKAWEVAFKAATLFWQTTAKDDRISQPFREICQQNYLKLVEAGGRLLNGL